MKKPELNDFKRDVYDGADEAEWYREYYKALEKYTEHIESTNKQLIDRLVRSTHAMESHPDYRYATLPKPSRHSQLFLDEVEINKIALRDAGVES